MTDDAVVHDSVARANRVAATDLPFGDADDLADQADAERGFVARLEPGLVELNGWTVFDIDAYDFLEQDCPDSVHPSLWRQARLVTIHGLFEVVPGFYQVRGMDLSNMTIVEGDRGVIVIDPLISTQTAAASLALYRRERGDRPVTAVIYTHSHVDHFGGVKGVVSPAEVAGGVPVIAPEHFVSHVVSENLYAGDAMSRRAMYMYGALLPKGPGGQVTAGLGPTTALGNVTLIPPTIDITQTGQELTVDGVRIVFQMTPGTEAPSEMNFFFPDHRLLCAAENATHNLHNTLTLRGALVRDPHVWSTYLNEAIELFGRDSDAVFASHHWPRWGNERVVDFLAKQRDLYGYIHDQTLRLLNQGFNGPEIAERFELPSSLAEEWHCRGYYGSVSHNVKAVYQRYMGWFDGNPANLWSHPPEDVAARYVEAMGGGAAVIERARVAIEDGDLRWAAELLKHVIFADRDEETDEAAAARELQAAVFEQLAYGAENATWRNFFLMGALELREGVHPLALSAGGPDIMASLSVEQVFDAMAIRVDGLRAAAHALDLNWTITDAGDGAEEGWAVTLANGVLTHVRGRHHATAAATVTLDRPALIALASGTGDLASTDIEGDRDAVATLFDLLDRPDPRFPISTP